MDTTHETYRQRHIRLHAALNELLVDYAALLRIQGQRGPLEGDQVERFLEGISVLELLEWSYHQTQEPTAESKQTR